MTLQQRYERLLNENTRLVVENAKLAADLATSRNDVGWQSMTLQAIAKITGLPADSTMADLEKWIRDHWRAHAK